jgi:adenosylhomocysteine nucleosidase
VTAVGIIVALPQEGRSLTRKRLKEGECIPLDHNRLLAVSDTGSEAASLAASMLVASGAQALVSWGCAGGLAPDLRPGNLVIPTQIEQSDGELLTVDEAWAQRLGSRIAQEVRIFRGKLLETPAIVSCAGEKQRLFKQSDALILDMESASIARAATALNLPFLAIRTVVDPASVTLPTSIANSFDGRGRLQLPALLARCLVNPSHLIDLIQLGRHFDLAMKTLVKVDELAGSDLLCVN